MALCDGDAEGKRLASVYILEPKELPAAGHLRLTKDEARTIAGTLGGGGDTQQLLLRRCWGEEAHRAPDVQNTIAPTRFVKLRIVQ